MGLSLGAAASTKRADTGHPSQPDWKVADYANSGLIDIEKADEVFGDHRKL